jgi:glycosyltransferase involved in cell wall biosynthesis
MQIGFVVPGGLNRRSGGFLYDRMLVQSLRERGWTVDVIPLDWGSYPADLFRNFSRASRPSFDPAALDVLLEDELSHPALLALNRRLRRQADLPIVAVVHHLRSSEARPAWINALYRRVEGFYLADVDGAVCNSLATQGSVAALWPEARPSVVAYPGRGQPERRVSAADVHTRACKAGPLRIVFLGNVIPRKGLTTLLTALVTLAELDWHLDVIGDLSIEPAYASRVRRDVDRAGLDRRVTFQGWLDGDPLADRLVASHVMVMPSTHEGFGIAYLDGMAYGLPAVATSAGGARELVRHGHNGLLVPPDDPVALADQLARLIEDRRWLTLMGQAALATYREHPTWRDSAEVVRGFLTGLKNKPDRPAMAGQRSHHFTTAGGPT